VANVLQAARRYFFIPFQGSPLFHFLLLFFFLQNTNQSSSPGSPQVRSLAYSTRTLSTCIRLETSYPRALWSTRRAGGVGDGPASEGVAIQVSSAIPSRRCLSGPLSDGAKRALSCVLPY